MEKYQGFEVFKCGKFSTPHELDVIFSYFSY